MPHFRLILMDSVILVFQVLSLVTDYEHYDDKIPRFTTHTTELPTAIIDVQRSVACSLFRRGRCKTREQP